MSEKILVDKKGLETYHKILKEDMLKTSFDLIEDLTDAKGVFEQIESERQTNENTRKSNEIKRVSDENKRVEAEKLREQAIEKVKSDTAKLIADTKKEITDYKNAKDTAINNDLKQFKGATTQSIDEYKNAKDTEINNILDAYKTAKDKEIDSYQSNKDTLINNKVAEIETAKQNIISTANDKISELEQAKNNMQNDVNSKLEEADNRITELQNYESQMQQIDNKNIEQDAKLKDIEYKNKVQDTYISGLFNENNDKRLTIEGEGNSLKLEGSKEGLVEVEKIVGNTLVNLCPHRSLSFSKTNETKYALKELQCPLIKANTTYTIIGNLKNNPNIVENKVAIFFSLDGYNGSHSTTRYTSTKGLIKQVISTKVVSETNATIYNLRLASEVGGSVGDYLLDDIIILEGDYTSKPIPSEYFEGMQSTFEEKVNDQGKYEIEILSRCSNLINTISNSHEKKPIYSYYDDKLNEIKPYLKYFNLIDSYDNCNNLYDYYYTDGGLNIWINLGTKDKYKALEVLNKRIAEGMNKLNKIKLLLNSPLLKGDEIVCKEDGLYHWHKMGKVVLDGSDDEKWGMPNGQPDNTSRFYWLNIAPGGVNGANTICDKSPTKSGAMADMLGIWVDANIILNVPKTVTTIDECKLLLSSNPMTVVYELAEPYYEKISDDKLLLEIPNNATLSVESVIPCQSISATYTGGIPSLYGMENSILDIEEHNVDMVATTFDMDYRLLEVEWALEDAGLVGISLASTFNLNRKGEKTMALSRYEQAKIMILGGAYDKATLTKQLTRYLEKNIITKEEYDELIALMEAKELVTGE